MKGMHTTQCAEWSSMCASIKVRFRVRMYNVKIERRKEKVTFLNPECRRKWIRWMGVRRSNHTFAKTSKITRIYWLTKYGMLGSMQTKHRKWIRLLFMLKLFVAAFKLQVFAKKRYFSNFDIGICRCFD